MVGENGKENRQALAVYFAEPPGVMIFVYGDIESPMWKDSGEGFCVTIEGEKPVYVKGHNVSFIRELREEELEKLLEKYREATAKLTKVTTPIFKIPGRGN